MIMYEPWSQETLKNSIEKYKLGEFSMLDIELSGSCNYKCIYCDSPDRTRKCEISFDAIRKLLESKKITWLFICGLGEPTVEGNYEHLINLLDICNKNNVKCSIFTNLSNLTDELQEYIRCGVLYILFKYDSINIKSVSDIYRGDNISEQIQNIKKIEKLVRINGQNSNLAASIVPTIYNRYEIVSIVEHCCKIGVFPFVGELEKSGVAQERYDNLNLSKDDLIEIKNQIEIQLGEKYVVPICPSVISGIHIDCSSKVVVDKFSGLSCHWFWLEEPNSETIMNFSPETTLEQISKNIIDIRQQRFGQVLDMSKSISDSVFGGCGGDIKALIKEYIEIHNS